MTVSATAERVVPGADVQALLSYRRIHFDHYRREPLPFACVRASGIEMEIADLDRGGALLSVLDTSGGYGSASLGAGHPAIRAAVDRALGEVGYATDEIGSLPRARLLGRLFGTGGLWCDHFPAGEYRVCGRNSGSEGMELALRLVLESRFDQRTLRYRPGRRERDTVLAFEGAWHGWSGGLIPLLNRRHFRVGLPGPAPVEDYGMRVEHLPFGVDVWCLRPGTCAGSRTGAAGPGCCWSRTRCSRSPRPAGSSPWPTRRGRFRPTSP